MIWISYFRQFTKHWVKQFKQGGSFVFSKEVLAYMQKLRAENKHLKTEVNILKKVNVFFDLS